jgi:AcrR family transcriptional regulator
VAATSDLPTEEEILRRGLATFAELGYEATSVRELSRRLGVSHNFVNDRFGSKEKFLKLLIDTAGSSLVDPLTAIMIAHYDDELMRFSDGIRAFLSASAANPDITRIISEESRAGGPRLEYVYHRHVEPIVSALRPGFDRLVAEGRLRDVPFVVMMFAAIAMAGVRSHRGIVDLLADGDEVNADAFVESLGRVVLGGLLVEPMVG